MYNVTLSCIHATMLCGKAVSITHSKCVFIAVLTHHAQCVCYEYCYLWHILAVQHFSTLFLKWHNFWENVIDFNET